MPYPRGRSEPRGKEGQGGGADQAGGPSQAKQAMGQDLEVPDGGEFSQKDKYLV